jgi:hypothetical protein
VLHERVDTWGRASRPGVRIARAIRPHSFKLGLVDQADVVEIEDGVPALWNISEGGRKHALKMLYRLGLKGCSRSPRGSVD